MTYHKKIVGEVPLTNTKRPEMEQKKTKTEKFVEDFGIVPYELYIVDSPFNKGNKAIAYACNNKNGEWVHIDAIRKHFGDDKRTYQHTLAFPVKE